MITFKRQGKGLRVLKNGVGIAIITKSTDKNDWGNYLLQHDNGRIDRHHTIESARSDAQKI